MRTVADRHRHAAYYNSLQALVTFVLAISTSMKLNDCEPQKGFSDFLIVGCKKLNYNEMDEDRLRQLAKRNCYRLLRIS